MEAYVKSLYDRLENDQKMMLFTMMQKAIDEMHNTGMIAQMDTSCPDLHDKDPAVRVTAKTLLAKSVGQKWILSATPVPRKSGALFYHVKVKLDPRFLHSICICLQGELEKLFLSGLAEENGIGYFIEASGSDWDLAKFRRLILQLQMFYIDMAVSMVRPGAFPASGDADGASLPAKKRTS